MSDFEFKDGHVNIRILYFKKPFCDIVVGTDDVTRIEVIMENGQMAGVPWFAVFNGDRMISKWNGAHIEGVGYF